MTRKSRWPLGSLIQKTALGLPQRLLDEARIRAMKEGRTLQEFVAEAVEQHLERIYETGVGRWDELDAAARRNGNRFRGWTRSRGNKLKPIFVSEEDHR